MRDFPRDARLLHAVAVVLVVAQTAAVFWMMPLDQRWFLHPDDHEVYQFAERVAETGLPVFPTDASGLSEWPLFNPVNSLEVGDKLVAFRPPAIFYLLAPAAAHSTTAAFVAMAAYSALTALLVYALAARLYGPLPGLFALGLWLFCAPVLFWGAFMFSNLPAVGFLLGAILLLTYDDPYRQALGGFVLSLSVLARYEYALVVAAVGAFWLWRHAVVLRRRSELVLPLAGTAAGALVVAALVYHMYDTLNFIGVTRGIEGTDTSTLENTVGEINANWLQDHYTRFVPTLMLVPIACGVFPFVSRNRPHWAIYPLGATTAFLAYFFLGNGFSPQQFLMSHSWSRYLLPAVAFGCIGFAHLARDVQRLPLAVPGLALAVVLCGVAGVATAQGPDGFASASRFTADALAHVEAAKQLPPNAVLVGDWASKEMFGIPILCPTNAPKPVQRDETLRVIHVLLEDGHRIFLATNSAPTLSAYDRGKYQPWIQSDPTLEMGPSSVPGFYEVKLRAA